MRQTTRDIGKRLREIRKTRSMRQKDMLLQIGMTQQQYQGAESGKDIRLSTFLRILEGLNVTLALVPNEKMGQINALFHAEEKSDSVTLLDMLKDLKD